MSSEIIKYKTGEILCEKNVVEDKPMYKIEKATWFSNKGEIRCEESYENGLKEGLCTYYKNGKIFVQGSYSHGYKDGKWIKIDEESGERIETNYSDGFKDGTEIIHLRDGRIIEDKFDKGIDARGYPKNGIYQELHPLRIEKLDFIHGFRWSLIKRDEIQDNLQKPYPKGYTDSEIEDLRDNYYHYIKYYDIAVHADVMDNPLNTISGEVISESGTSTSVSFDNKMIAYGFGPFYLEHWFLYKNLRIFGKNDFFVLASCSLDSFTTIVKDFIKDYFPFLYNRISIMRISGSNGGELYD